LTRKGLPGIGAEITPMSFFRSIKVQLILFFVIITLISSIIVSVANFLENRKILSESFNRELGSTTLLIQSSVEGGLQDAREAVQSFAKKLDLEAMKREQLQSLTTDFVDFADIFYNMYVYGREGDLMAVAYYDRSDLQESRGHRKNFREKKNEFYYSAETVLKDGQPRFTRSFMRRNRLFTAYVAPIHRHGGDEVTGLVSCGILVDNPKFKSLLRGLVPPYSGFICLLDEEGTIFGREGNIPGTLATFSMDELRKGLKSPSPHLRINDRPFRYALKEIPDARLFVLAAMSEEVIQTTLMTLIKELLAVNALCLILAIAVSTLVAHLLVGPVKELVAGLKEVSRGNYACRAGARAYGEMGEAIVSFNEMVGKLQKNRMIESLWNEHWKSDETCE
jgi:hypothetical protein